MDADGSAEAVLGVLLEELEGELLDDPLHSPIIAPIKPSISNEAQPTPRHDEFCFGWGDCLWGPNCGVPIGRPQWGQVGAESEISLRQSGHRIKAMAYPGGSDIKRFDYKHSRQASTLPNTR